MEQVVARGRATRPGLAPDGCCSGLPGRHCRRARPNPLLTRELWARPLLARRLRTGSDRLPLSAVVARRPGLWSAAELDYHGYNRLTLTGSLISLITAAEPASLQRYVMESVGRFESPADDPH